MPEPLKHVAPDSVITGWDFSTGAVKCLAFDLRGNTLAEVRLPTDLWTEGGVSELNLYQLEGQARASVRAMANMLRERGLLERWVAGGISATHHSAGRIDRNHVQVRRAICWNDQTLMPYHAKGLKRLGGQKKVRDLIGGPWAIRYTLSHLVKDEDTLPASAWGDTFGIVQHGGLAAGYLTGNFGACSISAAASTGVLDLRTGAWCQAMLGALGNEKYRDLAWRQLPGIVDHLQPLGPLSASIVAEAGLKPNQVPLIFPTSDDQQAGLVGGGAVDAGQVAVILGNSAVVNSSSDKLPAKDNLDAMRLNWGPYLWMRCYNNGAQFLDKVVGQDPDWALLEEQGGQSPPAVDMMFPFVHPEPALGVMAKKFGWEKTPPRKPGAKFRAALEALAYLIALGLRQHREAGQDIERISVSGGIAKSRLMCEILATVVDQPLELLVSAEGPALGAAVTALAALESHRRREKGDATPFSVADAVAHMVKFRETIPPNEAWRPAYEKGLKRFEKMLGGLKKKQ